jgi:hypothetical protein
MNEVRVHNYAFRKALAYVRNKRGKKISEKCQHTFENSIHQKLSTRSPYLPSYYPIKSFVIFLQIINSTLGEENLRNSKKINRYFDIGYYLYTGPAIQDSPYHYLDPHKPVSKVIRDFYNNLQTASGIIKNAGTTMLLTDHKVITTYTGLSEYDELFFYLQGVYSGMIKESSSVGKLNSKKEGDTFIFEVEVLTVKTRKTSSLPVPL